jgi:hypothetical protein
MSFSAGASVAAGGGGGNDGSVISRTVSTDIVQQAAEFPLSCNHAALLRDLTPQIECRLTGDFFCCTSF